MAAIRSQPATCKDGEMRSVAFHSSLPMQGHDLKTEGRRCTSAAAFQRCVPSAWPCYLRKRKADIFPFSRQENLPFAAFAHVNFWLTHCQDFVGRT